MSRQTITIWHCDANGCEESAPEETTGWTSAIYTHGCPQHGAEIKAHQATVTDQTRGRGRNEKTTWFIRCACGWRGGYETWSTANLTMRHLLHVKEATAKRLEDLVDNGEPDPQLVRRALGPWIEEGTNV